MESNSVCNHASDYKKIGRPHSGSPICLITSMITDRIVRHEVLLPIKYNHYNFRENKCISLSLSNVNNSPILENSQFGRVSGCYGYWDKFCDWWIKLRALNVIGRCICPITDVRLQPTVRLRCTIMTLHNYCEK